MRNERDIIIEKISLLKMKQSEDLYALKNQFHTTYESFKPLNLLKSTFNDITSTPEIKGDLVNGALNLATGFISRKVLYGLAPIPIKNILTNVFRFVGRKFFSKKQELQ